MVDDVVLQLLCLLSSLIALLKINVTFVHVLCGGGFKGDGTFTRNGYSAVECFRSGATQAEASPVFTHARYRDT